jgi:hypothetical protein
VHSVSELISSNLILTVTLKIFNVNHNLTANPYTTLKPNVSKCKGKKVGYWILDVHNIIYSVVV